MGGTLSVASLATTDPVAGSAAALEAYERLELALAHSHTILFSLDRDLRITWASEVVGMPPEAVLGRQMRDVLGEGEGGPLEAVATRVFQSGKPEDLEPTVNWLGQPRTYATRVAPVRNRDGSVGCLSIAITDVTDLRAVERDQRDMQAALELALRRTGTMAFGLDTDGRFLWVTGIPTEWVTRLTGRTLAELWPAQAPIEARARREVLAGAEQAEFDILVEDAAPAMIYRVVIAPRLDAAGRRIGVLGTAIDITRVREDERRAREQAAALGALVVARTADLAASEERFRVSLDATPDTIGIVEAVRAEGGTIEDFRIQYANRAWREVYGGGVEDATGRLLYRDFPAFAPRAALHRHAVESGTAVRDTVAVDRPTGTARYEFLLTPFRDGFVVASRDVTEQVEARRRLADNERRMRETVEGIDGVVWEQDVLTGQRYVSPKTEALTGVPADTWMDGALWRDRIVPEDRDRVMAVVQGDENAEIEYSAVRADGVVRRFRDRVTVVRSDDGRVIRRYGLIHDVTALRQLQARVRSAERLDAVGRFAGEVAHDVENILFGLGILADFARRAVVDGGDPLPDIDGVIEGIQRGSALTRSLLDFARNRPGLPVPVDLGPVLRDFEPILARLAGPEVALTIAVSARALVVVADRAGFEQVLLNLATNALEAMPNGGSLRISLDRIALSATDGRVAGLAKGRYAELLVCDTGVGMPPETLARIGEPFFTTREDGAGLGLPSVFGIVRAFGGTVEATSVPAEGSTFRVLLPLAPGATRQKLTAKAPALGVLQAS